jgi:hypothetical protein
VSSFSAAVQPSPSAAMAAAICWSPTKMMTGSSGTTP